MIYAHHVPKQNAAAQLTEFVRAEKASEPTMSPTVSRTAENSEQLSDPAGTEYAPAG